MCRRSTRVLRQHAHDQRQYLAIPVVEQRRYRLRFLNGCQSRFLILDFSQIPGAGQIGNEGGFLAAPVNLTATNGNRLLLGLAERADLIVDFTNACRQPRAGQRRADEPFGGGTPGVDFDPADPGSTGQVLQFRVVPAVAADLTTPPQFLVLPTMTRLSGGTTRRLALLEQMSAFTDGPAEARLGIVDPAGPWSRRSGGPVSENPAVGATEVDTTTPPPTPTPCTSTRSPSRSSTASPRPRRERRGHPAGPARWRAHPPESWENGGRTP